MKGHGYNAAELQSFYCVLDRMVTEVAERDLQLPVYVMIQRLFEAADQGERDPGVCASLFCATLMRGAQGRPKLSPSRLPQIDEAISARSGVASEVRVSPAAVRSRSAAATSSAKPV